MLCNVINSTFKTGVFKDFRDKIVSKRVRESTWKFLVFHYVVSCILFVCVVDNWLASLLIFLFTCYFFAIFLFYIFQCSIGKLFTVSLLQVISCVDKVFEQHHKTFGWTLFQAKNPHVSKKINKSTNFASHFYT